MIKQQKDKTIITIPQKFLESTIEIFLNELNQIEFKKKLNDKKKGIQKIDINISGISEIDFFAYQFLYFFLDYCISNLKKENINISEKSRDFIDFETKIGTDILQLENKQN